MVLPTVARRAGRAPWSVADRATVIGHNGRVTLHGQTLYRKLKIALGVITLGWLLVLVLWGPAPFAFSFDDAYYYFTIGRNWAHGHASTFDLIDRTNGYHPLWQGISIIPYLVGLDGLAAVRTLLVLQLALWAGALLLVARIVSTAVDGWKRLGDEAAGQRFCEAVVVAAFVALCTNPFLFKMTVNGLESGVVVPVGAALCALAIRIRGRFITRATTRERWLTGALLALAFLARTDAIILIGVLAVWCGFDADRSNMRLAERLRRGLEILAIPVAVVVVYLALNWAYFGTALQISGTVKRLPITPMRALLVAIWAVLCLTLLTRSRRAPKRSSRAPATRRFVASTGFYGVFCVALVGYYLLLQEVPYLWYFAPLALYGTLLLVLLVADLVEGAFVEASERAGTVSAFATRAPALILLGPLVIAMVWSVPATIDPASRSLLVNDAASGRWINSHLPPNARIASWDAGAIGYFAHRRVVNLDGVVNSRDYFDARRNGWTSDFLADRQVTWVANHGGAVQGHDPDINAQIRSLFGEHAIGNIAVVYRRLFTYSGTLDGSRTDTSSKQMGTYVYRLDTSTDNDHLQSAP